MSFIERHSMNATTMAYDEYLRNNDLLKCEISI